MRRIACTRSRSSPHIRSTGIGAYGSKRVAPSSWRRESIEATEFPQKRSQVFRADSQRSRSTRRSSKSCTAKHATLIQILYSKAVDVKATFDTPGPELKTHAVAAAKKLAEIAKTSTDPDIRRGLDAMKDVAAQLPPNVHVATNWSLLPGTPFFGNLILFIYVIVLVAIAGQSFGMMVMDLRVVTERFTRVGLWRTLARYVVGALTFGFVYGFFRIFARVQPFEKISGTRLVQGNAVAQTSLPLVIESQPQRV